MKPETKRQNLLKQIELCRVKIDICTANYHSRPSQKHNMIQIINVYEKQIHAFSAKIAEIDVTLQKLK